MHIKKGDELTITIEDLNITGQGIAKIQLEDKDFFVATTKVVPGDIAKVRIKKIKKKFIEATFEELVQPSPNRIPARSDHAEVCGSSPLEVLEYSSQLEFKEKEVKRIFTNLSNVDSSISPTINPIIPTDDIWFYRNKMEYSFGYDQNMKPVLGLHISGRRFDIFNVKDCHLAEPWINQLLDFFRTELYSNGFTPYSLFSGEGDLKNLTIRVGKNTSQAMLILRVSQFTDPDSLLPHLIKIQETFPQLTSIYLEIHSVQKGSPTTSTFHLLESSTAPEITETMQITPSNQPTPEPQKFTFKIGPTSFFQPNTSTAQKIYQQVFDLANPTPNSVIYDLFCGTGTIGITLAPFAKEVYGIDIVEESIEKAHQNLQLNNIQNATYICADAYKLTSDLDWPAPDILIVDPPRAGLTPSLIELITSLNPTKIIYVSCNIKTFSQDIQLFHKLGRTLKEVTPIDQFPHTRHLEIVGYLE